MSMDSFTPRLWQSLQELSREFETIPQERRSVLDSLAKDMNQALATKPKLQLIFICTHNSRRSHMAQIWAQTAAFYYRIQGLDTYSGGTETTAFNPRAVAALQSLGFDICAPDSGDNPRYQVRWHEDSKAMICFSKRYTASPNPSNAFWALMTCSEANEACPVVYGANKRFTLAYEDPKAADGLPEESATYEARARQIGREMMYLFARLGTKNARNKGTP